MKKRNIERSTPFSREIKEACGLWDLQGLCMNRSSECTIVVEAFDMEDDPVESYSEMIDEDEIYVKACLAEKIGAICSLLLHKNENGKSNVYVKQFMPDHASGKPVIESDLKMTEQEFVEWWKERKHGKQKNAYRTDMQIGTGERYFDSLLESNDTSWSSNADGFLTEKDETGDVAVRALIENRIADKCKVKSYDPNRYFGRDYKTWVGSIKLADALGVPLFLCTYSRRAGQDRYMGVGRIVSVDETGLIFSNGRRPDKNIMDNAADVKKWIEDEIRRFREERKNNA